MFFILYSERDIVLIYYNRKIGVYLEKMNPLRPFGMVENNHKVSQ